MSTKEITNKPHRLYSSVIISSCKRECYIPHIPCFCSCSNWIEVVWVQLWSIAYVQSVKFEDKNLYDRILARAWNTNAMKNQNDSIMKYKSIINIEFNVIYNVLLIYHIYYARNITIHVLLVQVKWKVTALYIATYWKNEIIHCVIHF